MIGVIPEKNDETFTFPDGQPPNPYEHPVHGQLDYVGFSDGKAFYKISNMLDVLALPSVQRVGVKMDEDKRPVTGTGLKTGSTEWLIAIKNHYASDLDVLALCKIAEDSKRSVAYAEDKIASMKRVIQSQKTMLEAALVHHQRLGNVLKVCIDSTKED